MTNEEMLKKIEALENENKVLKSKSNANDKYDNIVKFIFDNRAKYKSNRALAQAIANKTGLCSESSAFHYLSMQQYVNAYVRYELNNK